MRRPPSRENLLADAQPAISEPSTPTPITASTKKMPASTTWPTAPSPGPIGIATSTSRYGRRATAGARRKTLRSAPAGTMSSFCANFTPSATSWAQPWKPPAYMGPRRPCMWAMTLCSVWPTTRGRTMKTAKTMTMRRATSRASVTLDRLRCRGWGRCRVEPWAWSPARCATARPSPEGTPAPAGSPSPGTRCGCGAGGVPPGSPGSRRPPCGCAGPGGTGPGELPLEGAPLVRVRDARREHRAALRAAVVRLARFLGARPCLRHAGGQHEVLTEGVALEVLGEEERDQIRVVLEDDAEHLVRLAFVPGGPRVHTDRRRQGRGLVRHRRTQQQAVHPGGGGRQRRHMRAHPEARARFVHRAQPVEVRAAEGVPGGFEGGDPRGGRDVDRKEVVRLLGGRVLAEDLGHRVREPVEEGHFPSPSAGDGATRPLRSAAVDGRAPAASA